MTRLNNPQEYVVLTRGEYGTLADDKLTERISADDNYMFWKTGVLRFDNKPLRFIAGELASYYQVNLVLDSAGRNSVAGQLINISFINQDIGKALEELCLVAQCKWQKKNEQYIISAK
jgi:transmembrane sensor